MNPASTPPAKPKKSAKAPPGPPPPRGTDSGRAALYHRVSTEGQDPTLVREQLRAAALARGYRVTIDIEETGSGAARDRPGLGQIMAAAHRAEIEAVIIWKLDRLGRSTVDLLRNVETLKTCGVRFIVTTQGIDTFGDALGSFVLTILAGVAEYERTVFRERVDLGLRKARAAGKVFGRPKKTDVRAELVAELRASGLSWSACALTLGCTVALARRRAGEAARAAK